MIKVKKTHRIIFLITFLLLLLSGQNAHVLAGNYSKQVDSLAVDDTIVQYSLLLEGVEVSAHKKAIRLKGNTLLIDVESDEVLSRQENIYELLDRIPGLNKSGNTITALGNRVPVYYIDNRKVTDVSELEMLSVEQIRNIKFITTTNALYDSDGRPVIAIKTKRMGDGLAYNLMGDFRQGKFFSQKYRFNLTYNYKKWDIIFAYRYLHNTEWTGGDSQTRVMADTLWNKNNWTDNQDRTGIHHFMFGTSYQISPRSILGIQYTVGYNSDKINNTDSVSLVSNKGTSSFLNTLISGSDKTNVHHINVYYNSGLGKSWEMASYVDYIRKNGHSDRLFNEYDRSQGNHQIIYSRKSVWDVLAAHMHLSHESERYGTFAFGYDFSYTYGSDRIVYTNNNGIGNAEDKESKNALFLTYSKDIGTVSINTGLRYEYIHARQKDTYQDLEQKDNIHRLLPSLSLSHSAGMLMQSLSYSIETERPSFTVMNNNRVYTNRYSRGEGNMGLRTQTNHVLTYLLMYKFLYLNMSYEYKHRPLLDRYYSAPGNSAVIINRTENFSDRQSLTAMVNLRHTIKWWTPSVTLSMIKSFADYPGPKGTTLKDGRPVIFTNITSDLRLPHDWIISTRFEYNFGGYLEMIKIKPFSSVDLSIRKSFANDRWRLSLNAYDLFHQTTYNGLWQHDNIWINHHIRNDNRKFGFTVTYRFRNNKEVNKQTAAEKEMSRLKISEDE